MARYRKKPVEVEARRFESPSQAPGLVAWCRGKEVRYLRPALVIEIHIPTSEGTMIASLGDYIIKEPFPTKDRQFYPCKPDIFEATYNEIE